MVPLRSVYCALLVREEPPTSVGKEPEATAQKESADKKEAPGKDEAGKDEKGEQNLSLITMQTDTQTRRSSSFGCSGSLPA